MIYVSSYPNLVSYCCLQGVDFGLEFYFWLISRVLIFPFGFPAIPFEGQGLRGMTDPLVNRWVSLEIDAWHRDHPSLAYAIATAKTSSCSQSHRRPNHKPKEV